MKTSRRNLLLGSLGGVLATGALRHLAFAKDDSDSKDILVVVFLRGGCDGLNFLAPVDDPHYLAARGSDTRVSEKGADRGIGLARASSDFDFRLHPKGAPLKELYDQRELAFIHAAGLTHATRSHFDAQSLIERGGSKEDSNTPKSGWLTRYLLGADLAGLLPVVASTETMPESLHEYKNACCISELGQFAFEGHWKYGDAQKKILQKAYEGNSILSLSGSRALYTLDAVSKHQKRDGDGNTIPYQPRKGVKYPTEEDNCEELCNSLQTIASLIKMNLGLRVGLVDFDGWDTHQGQGYHFPIQINALSKALHAFYSDLSDFKERLTIVVMTEFGRRLRQNHSWGTDHGHGSLMILLGANVNGGKLYGKWPGLATEQLDQGVDLRVTTDYRTVLGEVLSNRMQATTLDSIFPNFPDLALNLVRKRTT
ncbi:MAG: DUF1501 domain-containing protein [Candidatus Obscuribacterales bacterium]|nr:DUF1501 domain-containing protein [Candidatus Obscuribacterales bacterium]